MAGKELPGISAEDIGKWAYEIFKRGKELIRKTVGMAGTHLTGADTAQAITRALGREARRQAIPFDVYRGLGFPGAQDLGNMFQFKCDFQKDFCAARDLNLSRSLNPELQTFSAWLSRHASQIPL